MRVLLDVTGCLSESRLRGIGRYVREFAYSLKRQEEEIKFELLINSAYGLPSKAALKKFQGLFDISEIHFWDPVYNIQSNDDSKDSFIIAEQIYTTAIEYISPDVVIFTEPFTQGVSISSLSGLNIITGAVVYDLIPAIYEELYLQDIQQREWYFERLALLREIDFLLTISESSKNEIQLFLPDSKVYNVGCDTSNRLTASVDLSPIECDLNARANFNIAREEFVLYTGGFDYRKSVDILVKGICKIPQSVKLVLAGHIHASQLSALRSLINELKVDSRVCLLGYVSDRELVWLYRNCIVYVSASQHEGFGLPILEAMRCGAPVLVAANTNSKELMELSEGRFKTNDVDDFSNQLSRLIESKTIREKLKSYGRRKQENYSWFNVANATIEALSEVSRNEKQVNEKVSLTYENAVARAVARVMPYIKDISTRNIAIKSINKSLFESIRNRQILVDVSILIISDSKSGVQRVVRSIYKAMATDQHKDCKVAPVYFCPVSQAFRYATYEDENEKIEKSSEDELVDIYPGDVFLGLDLNHNFIVNHNKSYLKLLSSPAKIFFVLYDLLPVKFPNYFDAKHNLTELHFKWLSGIANSDGVFAISQSVSVDYIEFCANQKISLEGCQVSWFHLGADIENSMPSHGVNKELESVFNKLHREHTILMVGTIEPRKGYSDILEAIGNELNRLDVNLVFVGKLGWKSDEVRDQIKLNPLYMQKLFWFDRLSDDSLCSLYEISDGLIAASHDEGFGLPIIEAAKHGIPIIARDIPVFREVGGTDITYFKFDSIITIKSEISKWISKIKVGNAVVSSAIKPLTWQQSADILLTKIFEQA